MNGKTVLYLVDRNTYTHKMSRIRFHAIEALSCIVNVIYWGPNWNNYNENLSLDENLILFNTLIDYIICYKPCTIKDFGKCKIARCITFNEMWDEQLTLKEINSAKPDLIVCHHENDMTHYINDLFKNIETFTNLVHIPHCAKEEIFYPVNMPKTTDLLLCGSVSRHYPLRTKLREVIKIMPAEFVCKEYKHPGCVHDDSFTDVYLKDFATAINSSKICMSCTSKYKYRLGKMIEIPMCGTVLACDLPNQDKHELEEIMIVIDEKWTPVQIRDVLVQHLRNPMKLENIRQKGLLWSQQFKQGHYANKLIKHLDDIDKKKLKVFLIGDELTSIKNKWICDVLKDEFIEFSGLNIVNDPADADIIWLLAPWSYRKISKKLLNTKFVVTTIHHIDWNKYEENRDYYKFIDNITNRYHTICPKTYNELSKLTTKPIITVNFWINENNFYKISSRSELRCNHGLPVDKFIVGSFQKDTEGKDGTMPKLCKGPDIFIDVVKDMYRSNPNIHILLTGWRRTYIMNELDKCGISYTYLELVDLDKLNELYNCLDLYIVSSRVEGGPRAIMECSLAHVPIISTDVGISSLVISNESIYDMNNFITYRQAKTNIDYNYKKAINYSIKKHMELFVYEVFYELTY